MQEKSLIKKNILTFLDHIGMSKYEFYKLTGITRGILDQNNGMSEENTARFIAAFPNVSLDWLWLNRGNMERTNAVPDKEVAKPPDAYQIIQAQKETINTQHKYIKFLENKIEELAPAFEDDIKPEQHGQKRKAG